MVALKRQFGTLKSPGTIPAINLHQLWSLSCRDKLQIDGLSTESGSNTEIEAFLKLPYPNLEARTKHLEA